MINSGFEAINAWLEKFDSPNTRRTYFRELKRLTSWLLSKKVTFETCSVDDLHVYLEEFAAGRLTQGLNKPVERNANTIKQTADAVRRMFKVLQLRQIRSDNPAMELRVPHPVTNLSSRPAELVADRSWPERLDQLLCSPLPDHGGREETERTLFLVMFSYWTCLKRTELAKASMADVRCENNTWHIDVYKKGSDHPHPVYIPAQAVESLKRYRRSRGLTAIPSRSETNVPLISRLKSEAWIDAWSIAHIISKWDQNPDGRKISLSSLRASFVAAGLRAGVPEIDLRRHVRSGYVIEKITNTLYTPNIANNIQQMTRADSVHR